MIRRREWLLGAMAAAVRAQDGAAPPTRTAKVEKLYKAPDIHPNAL